MKITVNGREFEIESECTLADVLTLCAITNCKGLAVAVNSVVVPNQMWQTYTVCESDSVLLVTAAQGG